MRREEIAQMEQEFVNSNPCVQSWLSEKARKSKGTARQYSNKLFHYWQWLKENKAIEDMQALLDDHKKKKKEGNEYAHIDLAKEYLFSEGMVLKSESTRGVALSAIREFYKCNRCPLPQEKIDLTVKEVDEQRAREKLALKQMTLEDIEKLISPMKIREKATMVILLQSGMGESEFVNEFNVCRCREAWLRNNGHVCEPSKVMRQLREGRERIKIEFVGRKSNDKSYFTFIGKDAMELLKRYLKFRKVLISRAEDRVKMYEAKERIGKKLRDWERKALKNYREKLQNLTPEWQDGQPIFISNMLNPIDKCKIQRDVQTYKERTGLTDRDFTPHNFRDIFKTECAHAGVDDAISEFFMGHSLDPLDYNKLDRLYPEDFEAQYSKVEPSLNIISHEGAEIDKQEVERLRRKNAQLTERLARLETILMAIAEAQKPEVKAMYSKQIEAMMQEDEEGKYPGTKLKLPERD